MTLLELFLIILTCIICNLPNSQGFFTATHLHHHFYKIKEELTSETRIKNKQLELGK